MNQTAQWHAKLKQDKEIADADREQKRDAAHMQQIGSILSAGAKLAKGLKIQDPTWYSKVMPNEEVASISTTYKTGVDQFNDSISGYSNHGGICVLRWVPSIGTQYTSNVTATAALNNPLYFSINNFMQELRKRNSRIGSYEPSDIAFYVLAATDLIEDIENVKVLLQCLNDNNAKNRYRGNAILEALGYSVSSTLVKAAETKLNLSFLIRDFNENIAIPYTLSFIQRRKYISTTIMADALNDRAQLYVFKKLIHYTWSDEDDRLEGSSSTFNNLLIYVQNIQARLNVLKDSAYFQTLLADMRGALDASKWYKISEFEDVKPMISVSAEAIHQIHNLQTYPSVIKGITTFDPKSMIIKRNQYGYIVQGDEANPGIGLATSFKQDFNYALFNRSDAAMKTKVLNFYNENEKITADDIEVATRLIPTFKCYKDGSTIYIRNDYSGTEVVVDCELHRYNQDGDMESRKVNTDIISISETSTTMDGLLLQNCAKTFAEASEYDWFPPIYAYVVNESALNDSNFMNIKVPGDLLIFGEFQSYFPYSIDQLHNMHRQAVVSEFFMNPEEFLPPIK